MLRDAAAKQIDTRKIVAVSVTTLSKTPLVGVVELQTSDGPLEFQINDEVAQRLSSDLDRFLSQS